MKRMVFALLGYITLGVAVLISGWVMSMLFFVDMYQRKKNLYREGGE